MQAAERHVIRAGRGSKPFTSLLVSIFLLLLIYPIFESWSHGRLLFQILFSFILISGVLSLGRERRILTFGLLLATPAFVFRWYAHITHTELMILLSLAFQVCFLAFVAVMILVHVLRSADVSTDTIVGGICVYLLLAVVWASLYDFIEIYTPGSFIDQVRGALLHPTGSLRGFKESLYFSITTLTTLGYGDIVPVSNSARGLAVLESMTGQLYVAIFVARLVGLHISTSAGHHKK